MIDDIAFGVGALGIGLVVAGLTALFMSSLRTKPRPDHEIFYSWYLYDHRKWIRWTIVGGVLLFIVVQPIVQ